MTFLEIRQWQRAFEWTLSRDAYARDAIAARVRQHNHDVLGSVQVIELATLELRRRCGESVAGAGELATDVRDAVESIKATVKTLVAPHGPTSTTLCAPAIERGLARVRAVLDARVTIQTARSCALSDEQLEHLVVGIVLAQRNATAISDGTVFPIELLVREREVDGATWIELVCGSGVPALPGTTGAIDDHELAVVEAIATLGNGEVSRFERRGGGEEIVVAIPAVS